MKKYLLPFFIVAITLSSCYKTGEIIFQTTCKTTAIDYRNNNLFYPPGQLFTPYVLPSPINFLYRAEPYMEFTYGGTNHHLLTATGISNGVAYTKFDFSYTAPNNLTKITESQRDEATGLFAPVVYWNLVYPPGTASSIADDMTVEFWNFSAASPFYIDSLHFNNEFQLTSIIGQNGDTLSTLEYNFAGNCTRLKNYAHLCSGGPNTVATVYDFSNYDDKINPARTDRYLQLFLHDYSKNNPGFVKREVFPHCGPVNNIHMLDSSGVSYNFYNNHNLPTIRNGFFFASYSCNN